MTLRAVGAEQPGATTETTSTLPTPLAPSAGAPSARDLRLFETSPGSSGAPFAPGEPVGAGADSTGGRPPRGRRRSVLLSAAGAVVVVVGAAGYASGLFSTETPSRDGALPDEVRASVPAPSTSEASATPESSAPSAPETSRVAVPVRQRVPQRQPVVLAVPVGVERLAHAVPVGRADAEHDDRTGRRPRTGIRGRGPRTRRRRHAAAR